MILNIAHRGARSLAPENTLAAGRKALQVGADMWELDVAVTADEHLIVFHEVHLGRIAGARLWQLVCGHRPIRRSRAGQSDSRRTGGLSE